MQCLADEADHELVVLGVEPVTREAHVVREIGRGVRFSDRAVLAQDPALFARFEPREGARTPERVPDGPGPGLVQHRGAWSLEQPKTEVRLEPRAVAATEHGEIGTELELAA